MIRFDNLVPPAIRAAALAGEYDESCMDLRDVIVSFETGEPEILAYYECHDGGEDIRVLF